jgi:recombination associated protein RdgC
LYYFFVSLTNQEVKNMWFKNLFIYRLPKDFKPTAASLKEKIALKVLQPCSGLDKQTHGWVACHNDELVHSTPNGQFLIAMGVEAKILPASVINQFTKDRVADIEAQQGSKMGRKQVKQLKELVAEELLPRAFVNRRVTYIWLDTVNGFFVVDASTSSKAEEVLSLLSKTFDDLPLQLLHTELSPVAAMTNWITSSDAPHGFTIDRELELRSSDEGKATVRYANHALEGEEMRNHIAAGKRSTRLGLTWNDRVSFVLTEQCQVKRLSFLDAMKDDANAGADSADEVFDAEFTIMTGELAKLIKDLLEALGGEVKK